jgi:DNA-binding PadR family transcriptional regulator
MHAASAGTWGGHRHRHHHHHHRGPRGWDELIAFMQGRGGPFGGDPRQFKAMFWGAGPGGPWGGPGHRGRGRGGRARRGDVRAAMLLLLEEQPQNGYQLIQEIERRTEGVWKPSPGSVYPALQQLEDEGLVQAAESEGKRAYELTAEGRDYVAANREELGDPFEAATGGMDEGVFDLRGLMFQVGAAAMQVAAAGHTDEARKILADTRRALYKILAEDDPGDDTPPAA